MISVIVAPLARSARVTACLSASVTPSTGAAHSAEPPPDSKQQQLILIIKRSDEFERPLGRANARFVWHGMTCFDDFYVAWQSRPIGQMSVGRHDESCNRRRESLQRRLHHCGGRFADRNHKDAAMRRRRQNRLASSSCRDGLNGLPEQRDERSRSAA